MKDTDQRSDRLTDDEAFRHVMGLVRVAIKDNPQREKTLREIMIHRNPKHAREVLEEMAQKTFASKPEIV